MICNELNIEMDNISVSHLINKRVSVHWNTKQVPNAWYKGTVIDYDPYIRKHWIKYDIEDNDGTSKYPKDLIGPNPGNWKFANDDQQSWRDIRAQSRASRRIRMICAHSPQ